MGAAPQPMGLSSPTSPARVTSYPQTVASPTSDDSRHLPLPLRDLGTLRPIQSLDGWVQGAQDRREEAASPGTSWLWVVAGTCG